MLIFQKYFLKNFISSCLIVTGILVSIVWITQTLRFVEAVSRKIDTNALFVLIKLSLYMLPNLVVVLLPVGLAIGCLFTLYKLLEDREILALWAGGVSTNKMLNIIVGIGFLSFIFSFVLQAYVSPLFMNKFRQLERSVRQNVTLSFIEANAFQEFGDITLYVKHKRKDNLFNIVAYVEPHGENPYTIIAEKGAILKEEITPKLVLENGVRQERKPENGGKISMLHFDRSIVEIGTTSKKNINDYKKPSEYFLWELFSFDDITLKNKMLVRKLKAEAHQRFISPYLSFLFPVLAFFILIRQKYQRRGYAKRAILAVSIIMGLQAFTLISINSHITSIFYLVYFVLAGITGFIFYQINKFKGSL